MENLHLLAGRKDFIGPVETPHGRLFLAHNDDGIALRYLHGYVYEPVSMALWCDRAKTAKVAVDVGAHTGIYTLAALKAGASDVLSVEPYFLNAARLMLNLRINGYPTTNVAIAAAGAAWGIGELFVPVNEGAEWYCTVAGRMKEWKTPRAFPVRTMPLDLMIGEAYHEDISLIKLDVEYTLRSVLAGASKVLAHRPDLIFEAFEDGLTEMLTPFGYAFYQIDEHRGLRSIARIDAQKADEGKRNVFASVRPVESHWFELPA